ncbi:MAG TPA: AAA family ATPase [Dehalococcoidia bacterium]|nr:AAA family ATPase [Dehalococcoidia bacterium]
MAASDLPPLIQALLTPDPYPHPTGRISLVQTHISYVLLTRDYVYKIKKPVDFGFLNYSTLAKRRYYCQRELKLNRRLCGDTYLAVVPIRKKRSGYHLEVPKRLGGTADKGGKIVEYAVMMRRLPEERMMHRLLERNQVTRPMLRAVAEKLVPFHQSGAETSKRITEYGDWAIRYNVAENVRQWTPYIGRTLTAEQDTILRNYIDAFYARRADVMGRRVDERRIRVCHSDLRSDAVVFLDEKAGPDGICIMDCVEFNRRITHVDVARDVTFLSMDLEYRGRPDLASAFVKEYVRLADDPDLADVLPYYACYNAQVRGKVESFMLDVPGVPESQKRAAAKRARRYWELAARYAESLPPAMLVITCGLPGTGKSTIARGVARRIDAEVLQSDVVRKRLEGMPPDQRVPEEFRKGLYSAEMTERTYEAVFAEAREHLMSGRSVVLDASFIRREHRRAAARLARETGAQFACIEVAASDRAVRERLAGRLRRGRDPSDARWDIYLKQKPRYQRPTEVPPERLIRIENTRAGGKKDITPVLRALHAISPLSVPG